MRQPIGRFAFVFASAVAMPGALLFGQAADPGSGSAPAQRLDWLNARVPPSVAAAAKVAAPPKVRFRANSIVTRPVPTVELGPVDLPSSEAHPPKPGAAEPPAPKTASAEGRGAKASLVPAKPAVVAEPTPAKTRSAVAAASPTPKVKPAPVVAEVSPVENHTAKASPAAVAKSTPSKVAAASPATKSRTADGRSTPAPKTAAPAVAVAATPVPKAKTPEVPPTKTASTTTNKPPPQTIDLAKLTTVSGAPVLPSSKTRTAEIRATPAPKPTPAPVVAEIPPAKAPLAAKLRNLPAPAPTPVTADGHYPWKNDIVTTIFWIGEPVGGHNFTPNYASSWDSHWTQAYGGFDTPDTNFRRNFIPVKFTPRQNPFYVALPYNDVTRGTTKPEARHAIPWFKEAFRKEGESVCRDRWVAIRSHSGKVAFAQWSDCGPFRTDHWQYVFGNERPKPNLNKGAGLDVSPAVRDYLGLESTDVTDWKFVDLKDVPGGPWALYGTNNVIAMRGGKPAQSTAKSTGRAAPSSGKIRVSEL